MLPEKAPLKESLFNLLTLGALALYLVFILSLLLALVTQVDLASFLSALLSPEAIFAARLSLLTASLAAFLSMLVAIPAAYALSRAQFRGKGFLDSLLDLPLVLPPIAVGVALLIFFRTSIGRGIEATGLEFVFTPLGIILAQFTLVCTFALRLMKASFDAVNPRYEQVARTLGCGALTSFLRIALPLARRGILAAAVLTWARAVGDFGATVIFVGATPFKTETLPIAIFLNLSTLEIQRAISLTLLLLGLSLVALLSFRWIMGRGYPT